MGYCYEGRKLCCDVCGVAGGVRKRKCQYGYCTPPAVCKGCWPTARPRIRSVCDDSCAPAAKKLAESRRRERELLARGEFLRCSAVGRDETVEVWFRNAKGERRVFSMGRGTYRAIPLTRPATPECFQAYGSVTEGEQ
jgi:hypothetical protein